MNFVRVCPFLRIPTLTSLISVRNPLIFEWNLNATDKLETNFKTYIEHELYHLSYCHEIFIRSVQFAQIHQSISTVNYSSYCIMLYRYILILHVTNVRNKFVHLGISFIISNLSKFITRRTIVTNDRAATLKKTTNFPIHLVERSKLEMANISVKIVDASILSSPCESFTIIVEY